MEIRIVPNFRSRKMEKLRLRMSVFIALSYNANK